jgi:hypothetical protein
MKFLEEKNLFFYLLNNRLIKGLQFSLICRMNYTEAIERASTLFQSIPIEYFNNSDVNIK